MIRAKANIINVAIAFSAMFINLHCHSQDYKKKDIDLERLVDEIYAVQDLDLNYEDLYENLAQLLATPLDLNLVNEEQLRSLYVLNEAQLKAFFNYRNQTGPILSIYELQSIPLFDDRTISYLINFVSVTTKRFVSNTAGTNYFITRVEKTLENKKGYLQETDSTNRYLGSPEKVYARLKVSQTNMYKIGITMEKDAGEAIVWNPSKRQYGFDFLSFHGQVLNRGKIKNILVGDYQAQFGQGLTLGGGFGAGKGAETITTIRRSNLGFLPYSSVNEAGFFRGVSLCYSLNKNLTFNGFFSANRRDGRKPNDTLSDNSVLLSSISYSGLHRTAKELSARKLVSEMNSGMVVEYKNSFLETGVIYLNTLFDQAISRIERPYTQYGFSGKSNTNVGAFINVNLFNATLFAEAAQTVGHGRGIVGGLLANLIPQLDVSLLYRNYSPNFYSFYGNGFAENTQAQNESGVYWGWKYTFSKMFSLRGYLDLFQFPWLRYRSYAPSIGYEWLLRFDYQPSKNIAVYLQARSETKDRNLSTSTAMYQTSLGTKNSFWINCEYSVTSGFSFKTRIQASTYQLGSTLSKGIAIVQDVSYTYKRLSLSSRYALFQTDDYDNRLYIYERDVWLGFTFQPYYGVGTRSYILLQYRLFNKIDIWLRWATTSYHNVNSIGTGLETINGSSKNDVKTQVRWRF
jgi:hypothetical protein